MGVGQVVLQVATTMYGWEPHGGVPLNMVEAPINIGSMAQGRSRCYIETERFFLLGVALGIGKREKDCYGNLNGSGFALGFLGSDRTREVFKGVSIAVFNTYTNWRSSNVTEIGLFNEGNGFNSEQYGLINVGNQCNNFTLLYGGWCIFGRK